MLGRRSITSRDGDTWPTQTCLLARRGLLATATVNSSLTATAATQNGLAQILHHWLWLEQFKAIGITIALALIGTAAIASIVRGVLGLRIAPEIERQGIDINVHGEEGHIASG